MKLIGSSVPGAAWTTYLATVGETTDGMDGSLENKKNTKMSTRSRSCVSVFSSEDRMTEFIRTSGFFCSGPPDDIELTAETCMILFEPSLSRDDKIKNIYTFKVLM